MDSGDDGAGGLAKRARIVLLAPEGIANTGIAERADASVVTVLKWLFGHEGAGLSGLSDAERSGRPLGAMRRSWRPR